MVTKCVSRWSLAVPFGFSVDERKGCERNQRPEDSYCRIWCCARIAPAKFKWLPNLGGQVLPYDLNSFCRRGPRFINVLRSSVNFRIKLFLETERLQHGGEVLFPVHHHGFHFTTFRAERLRIQRARVSDAVHVSTVCTTMFHGPAPFRLLPQSHLDPVPAKPSDSRTAPRFQFAPENVCCWVRRRNSAFSTTFITKYVRIGPRCGSLEVDITCSGFILAALCGTGPSPLFSS
jgi:hypothetical protein